MINIKTSMVNKLIQIRGHVTRARPKRLRVIKADFQCCKCNGQFQHHFTSDGRYTTPTHCRSSGHSNVAMKKCRSKQFILLKPTAKYFDYQEIKIQEVQSDEGTIDVGRTPRQMEVEVTADLVDLCNAGDVITVVGIVRAVNTAFSSSGKVGKRALETSTYKLYLRANSLVAASTAGTGRGGDGWTGPFDKSKMTGREQGVGDRSAPPGTTPSSSAAAAASTSVGGGTCAIHFTVPQLRSITELAHADHRMFDMTTRMAFPFDLLVRSLCPSIIGHDMVKAGIILGLLGGTPPVSSAGLVEGRSNSTSSANAIRSNSHVLIVGDPGMGKSQMLLAASQIAARSVYVGGNTASTTGLTVSLTKEAGGEVGIEAGALVLADQGVCCIDEFDKMAKANQDGLLEAMEQQQISIAKAGVVASLPARCSVIAAANPKHGCYNMGKTVAENLNMATPLLSRFDLVFILRDKADQEQDRMVSSNIMNLYRQRDGEGASQDDMNCDVTDESSLMYKNGRIPLMRRLAWVARFQKEPLPADLVRDYISYAREYCKPKLTEQAAAILKDYFMSLRHGANRGDSAPITTRQLEALIRLSQARAKACLREFVLKEDAEDVVELMTQSVDQVHMDEDGIIDRTRGGAGGTSNRKAKKAFTNELKKHQGSELTMENLRTIAAKCNCDLNDFNSLLENLRESCCLQRNSNGTYTPCF